MHPNEAEFYDRLNKLEKEDNLNGYGVIALCVSAISGFIVGVMVGYFAGIFFPIGG